MDRVTLGCGSEGEKKDKSERGILARPSDDMVVATGRRKTASMQQAKQTSSQPKDTSLTHRAICRHVAQGIRVGE